MATDILQSLIPNQGPPNTVAPANLVPFIAPDANVNSYDTSVQQQTQSNDRASQLIQLLSNIPGMKETMQQSAQLQKDRTAAGWNYNNPNVEGGVSYPQGTQLAGLPGYVPPQTKQANDQQQSPEAVNDLTEDQKLIAQIKKNAGKGQGFIPHALATLAALSGNFGPAMMLEEQKRKTAMAIDAAPLIVKANQYKNRGEYDKAISLLQEGMGNFGARSPEIATHLSKEIENIDKKSQGWGTAETKFKALVAIAKDQKAKGSPVPWENWIPVGLDIINKKTPGGEQALLDIMKMATEAQVMKGEGNTYNFNNSTTATVTTRTAPVGMSEANIDPSTEANIAKVFGLDKSQAVNYANGQSVMDANGQPIPIVPQMQQAIRNVIMQGRQQFSAVQQGTMMPVSPEYAEILNTLKDKYGLTQDQVNAKQLPLEMKNEAFDMLLKNKEYIASASFRAIADGPIAASGTGKDIIDIDTSQSYPTMSIRQANLDPKKAILGPDQVKQTRTLLEIDRRLATINNLVSKLPSSDDKLDRVGSYIDRTFNSYFSINPSLTGQQAFQAAIKDTVEKYANSQGQDAARYDYITRGLTSNIANKENALAAVASFKQLIATDKEALLKQGKIDIPQVGRGAQQLNQQESNQQPTQEQSNQQAPLGVRNNNPLNIKLGSATQKWVDGGDAIVAGKGQDGGNFLKFKDRQTGLIAAQQLLSSPVYNNLSLDSALRKWSGKGYGAEIPGIADIEPSTKIKDLSSGQLAQVVRSMEVAEGNAWWSRDNQQQTTQAAVQRQSAVSTGTQSIPAESNKPTRRFTIGN